MKVTAMRQAGAGFKVRTATRIAGVPALGYGSGRNALGTVPPLGHGSPRNSLGGLLGMGAAECGDTRHRCCLGGKYYRDGEPAFTRAKFSDAVCACGRAKGAAHDVWGMQVVLRLVELWRTNPGSIPNHIYDGAIYCADAAYCPPGGELDIAQQATKKALEHRDVVTQAIEEQRSLTPEELGVPPPVDVLPSAGDATVTDTRTPLFLPSGETPRRAFKFPAFTFGGNGGGNGIFPSVAYVEDTGSGPGIQVGDYQIPWMWLVAGAGAAWLAFKKR